MSAINFHTKEISVKIVYYGPGLCGKTTSLQSIYGALPDDRRPQMVSLATEVDRTIFFDFLPLTAYKIRDFNVRLQLYTVPGQVFYNATRKLVLNGVDGVVFVADSQRAMRDSNLESLQNLEENLGELGMEVEQVPMVISCNKRDLGEIDTVEDMDRMYNPRGIPLFATVATRGEGVFDALKTVSQLVVNNLIRKGLGGQLDGGGAPPSGEKTTPPPIPASSAPSNLSEAAAQSAQAQAVPPPRPAAAPPPSAPAPAAAPPTVNPAPAGAPSTAKIWPPAAAETGELLEAAMAGQSWSAVINAADQLLNHASAAWQTSGGGVAADPLMTFILLRGISGKRYRAFKKDLEAVRGGGAVGQKEAMNAFILALEALW